MRIARAQAGTILAESDYFIAGTARQSCERATVVHTVHSHCARRPAGTRGSVKEFHLGLDRGGEARQEEGAPYLHIVRQPLRPAGRPRRDGTAQQVYNPSSNNHQLADWPN